MEVLSNNERIEKSNIDNLNLLSIFYFVFGGLGVLGSLIMFLYTFIFGVLRNKVGVHSYEADTVFTILTSVFGIIGVFVLAAGVLQIFCGLKLRKQTNRTFSVVIAALTLLSFPLGTALGVLTLIVLSKSSVKELYLKRKGEMEEALYGMKRDY